MARQRNPNRDEAKKKWLDSFGAIATKQLAEEAGVTQSRIRKWKSEDSWIEALDKCNRKRGGQPGNKNAEGAGAPLRNVNAQTHGAYSTVRFTDLPLEQRDYIEKITLDTEANMLNELQLLIIKEINLQNKIAVLESDDPTTLYIDKVVHMYVPGSVHGDSNVSKEINDIEEVNRENELLKTAMKTVVKASPFDRAMKLEAELNKTHGRIIKLLDSIKTYELEGKRFRLEEQKYNLAKQKLSGVFEINDETGEIDDESDNITLDLNV